MPVLAENRCEFVKAVAALDVMQADIGFGTASSRLESTADTTTSDGLEVSAVTIATLITESSVEAVVTGTTSEPRGALDALAPSLDAVPSLIGEAAPLLSDEAAAPSLAATPSLDAAPSLDAFPSLSGEAPSLAATWPLDATPSLDASSSLAATPSLDASLAATPPLVAALPSTAASSLALAASDFPLSTTHSARHLLFRGEQVEPVQYLFLLYSLILL